MDRRIFVPCLFLLASTVFMLLPPTTPPENVCTEDRFHIVWNRYMLTIVPDSRESDAEKVPNNVRPLLFERININEADTELLQTIPGIGPRLAKNIIDARKLNGSFTNPEMLLSVNGIGEKRKMFFSKKFSFE